MSEDTSGNPDVTGWPEWDAAFLGVRSMQLKLHRWASEDCTRRFDDLYNLVYDPAFLVHAFERVAANAGSKTAGVDRATVAYIESRIGVEHFLEDIRTQLKARTFRPMPVRQVMIPKASGKMRALGIPTVADRVVQGALKLVLEPIFEADFLPCSYGFRPRRRAQDAIAEIQHFTTRGYQWVLEADIQSCFDTIDHRALMDRIRARIKDKKVVELIKAFLTAGVLTADGRHNGTLTGTPQGGILSPLLANIALSTLDEHFVGQWRDTMYNSYQRQRRINAGLGCWKLVRYADDFVICVRGEEHHARALRSEVAQILAPMGLVLASEKTRVVHIDEGFDFLGFHIRRMRKRGTNRHYVYTAPSRKAKASARERLRRITHRSTLHLDFDVLLRQLNRSLQGWANYFRHGVSKAVFAQLDSHAWRRIRAWLRRKHGPMSGRDLRRRFCDAGWRFAHNGVAFRGASSVTVTRYRYRGTSIATPWTLTPSATG